MKKYILKKHPGRIWQVAELDVYENGKLIETISINRFYSISEDWLIIYDSIGGQDYITKGQPLRKIFIGDSEFEEKEIRETA